MITLLKGLLRKTVPTVCAVDSRRRFQCDIEVTALNGQVEAGVLVRDEVERDLRQTRQWY